MVKKAESKKITNLWDKLSYWQRGGVIGLFVGIMFNIYINLFKEGYYLKEGVASWQALPNILPLISHSFTFSSAINEPATSTSIMYIILWYAILGAILGLIYKLIKQKYPKHLTSLFILTLIVFVVFILLLNFLILIGLFSIYA